MSCWVVPTLAAELWGVPLELVLGQVRTGTVASKVDGGLVLVDVGPDSRPPARLADRPKRSPRRRRRRTYVPADLLEQAEAIALDIELKPGAVAPCGQALAPSLTAAAAAADGVAALGSTDLGEPSVDE